MDLVCDVLVVGAGPAGLSAARSALLNNKSVICVEKKEGVGLDIRCAEGVGAYLLPLLPFKIPEKYFDLKMDGIIFYSEGVSLNLTGGFWDSFSLNRAGFEEWLSKEVILLGGKIFTSTEFVSLSKNKIGVVESVLVKNKTEELTIFPKFVIAADGVESKVLSSLGVYKLKKGDYAEVYSWEMSGAELIDSKKEQVFFGRFTPKGYAYIFPKGGGAVNVGVGGIKPKMKLEFYFKKFLSIPIVKKQLSSAKYTKDKSKKAPFFYVSKERVFGNVYAVGDSANDNFKPFVEGILPSIIIGDFIGKNLGKKYIVHPLSKQFIESNEMLKIIKQLYSFSDDSKSGLVLMLSIVGIIPLKKAVYFYKKHTVAQLKKLVK